MMKSMSSQIDGWPSGIIDVIPKNNVIQNDVIPRFYIIFQTSRVLQRNGGIAWASPASPRLWPQARQYLASAKQRVPHFGQTSWLCRDQQQQENEAEENYMNNENHEQNKNHKNNKSNQRQEKQQEHEREKGEKQHGFHSMFGGQVPIYPHLCTYVYMSTPTCLSSKLSNQPNTMIKRKKRHCFTCVNVYTYIHPLRYITLHYIALHYTTVPYTTLHCIQDRYSKKISRQETPNSVG